MCIYMLIYTHVSSVSWGDLEARTDTSVAKGIHNNSVFNTIPQEKKAGAIQKWLTLGHEQEIYMTRLEHLAEADQKTKYKLKKPEYSSSHN